MPDRGFLAALAVTALLSTGCAQQGAASRPPVAQQAQDDGVTQPAVAPTAQIPAFRPRAGRERPVVAVIAPNGGAEVTDFVVPYGILAASGVADVVALSTAPGPIPLFPALTIEADATTAEFDREHPDGADYVIVPAVHDPADAALTGWIREQAARGATIVGVCDGVLVLAEAGLLDGRRATGHWFSVGRLGRRHPAAEWVRGLRYVADGNVVTTTGVSASVPVSLALVEAIAGRTRAEQFGRTLGVHDWSPAHDSEAYGFDARHVVLWLGNIAAFWRNEKLGVAVGAGVDEVTLALFADAWSRTYRSKVLTIGPGDGPVRTRGGLRLLPDRSPRDPKRPHRMLDGVASLDAGSALEHALAGIADAYGERTAEFVALQLEYPWTAARETAPARPSYER